MRNIIIQFNFVTHRIKYSYEVMKKYEIRTKPVQDC